MSARKTALFAGSASDIGPGIARALLDTAGSGISGNAGCAGFVRTRQVGALQRCACSPAADQLTAASPPADRGRTAW
jgi:hypothetical protein